MRQVPQVDVAATVPALRNRGDAAEPSRTRPSPSPSSNWVFSSVPRIQSSIPSSQPPSAHPLHPSSSSHLMENLPTEIAVEIAACLAESSDFAAAEVGSLRATCKKMRQVCHMPEVGRHPAVHPLLPIGSWDLYYNNGFR